MNRPLAEIKLATNEQITEAKRLCSVLKMEEATDKWLKKHNVENLDELSSADIDKLITFYQETVNGKGTK
jgi:hypothetical protein